jgi:nitrogen fixation-related uncharacterized protein
VVSLLVAIVLLMVGVMALLWVSHSRDQHYQNELQDVRRELIAKENELRELRRQLRQTHRVNQLQTRELRNKIVNGNGVRSQKRQVGMVGDGLFKERNGPARGQDYPDIIERNAVITKNMAGGLVKKGIHGVDKKQ